MKLMAPVLGIFPVGNELDMCALVLLVLMINDQGSFSIMRVFVTLEYIGIPHSNAVIGLLEHIRNTH